MCVDESRAILTLSVSLILSPGRAGDFPSAAQAFLLL